MAIKRETSTKTWNELDHLIAKIRQRAAQANDQQTYGEADRASALLRNLSVEIQMEDEHKE
jgi:hypothetical protein